MSGCHPSDRVMMFLSIKPGWMSCDSNWITSTAQLSAKKARSFRKKFKMGSAPSSFLLTNSCVVRPLAMDCGLKWSRKTYVCGGTSTPIEGSGLLRAAFCGIDGPQVPPSDQPRHGKSHYTWWRHRDRCCRVKGLIINTDLERQRTVTVNHGPNKKQCRTEIMNGTRPLPLPSSIHSYKKSIQIL